MAIGYLVTIAVLAWVVFFAVVAPSPNVRIGRISFWSGLVVNEIPALGALWLGFSTVVWVIEMESFAWYDAYLLAIAGAVAIGLAYLSWRSIRARGAVAQALADGLGVTGQQAFELARRRGVEGVRTWLFPIWKHRRMVERFQNLSYGDGEQAHLLDLYRHRDAPEEAPILVYFHGGGYSSGRKNREARALFYRLAQNGWVCVSANYRLRPKAGFREHLSDAKQALAWAHQYGGDYGGDPQSIFVAGSSAGGHLASICALTPNTPQLQPGIEDQDTSVAAAICFYGYYNYYFDMSPQEELVSSPLGYPVTDQTPPFFITHGTHDSYVRVEAAWELVQHLEQSPSPVVYAELPGAQHAFDIVNSPRYSAVIDGVEAFSTAIRSGRTRRSETPRR